MRTDRKYARILTEGGSHHAQTWWYHPKSVICMRRHSAKYEIFARCNLVLIRRPNNVLLDVWNNLVDNDIVIGFRILPDHSMFVCVYIYWHFRLHRSAREISHVYNWDKSGIFRAPNDTFSVHNEMRSWKRCPTFLSFFSSNFETNEKHLLLLSINDLFMRGRRRRCPGRSGRQNVLYNVKPMQNGIISTATFLAHSGGSVLWTNQD